MITVDFNRLKIKPGFKILDIGCGSGRHTAEILRFKRIVAVGADINYNDVHEAKNRLTYHENVGAIDEGIWMVTVTDICNLPFKSDYFDVVICSEVLEHIPDQEKAISELLRVVKQDQQLVVSVPRYLPERICWALSSEYNSASAGHIRIYNKKELIDLVEQAGAKKIDTHYAHSIHTPYWWLKCMVGPNRKDNWAVNLYHRVLVWEIMQKPKWLRFIDQMLNPIIGKSIVFYFNKNST